MLMRSVVISYRLDIILRLIRNDVLSLQLVKGEEEAVRGGGAQREAGGDGVAIPILRVRSVAQKIK